MSEIEQIVDALESAKAFIENGTPIRQGSDVAHELIVALDAAKALAAKIEESRRYGL